MAKKRKKRIYSYEERLEAQNAVKSKAKSFHFRLAGTMLAIFALLTGAYALCLRFYLWWATPVLYLLTSAVFLAFFFINRGFSRDAIEKEALPASWSEEKKAAFVSEDIKRKTFAKKIMVVLVPLLLLVGIDILFTLVIPMN